MEDVEANRTIIPMSLSRGGGQARFISQPSSPCSVSRPSSLVSSLTSSSMYSPSSGSMSSPSTPVKTMKHYEESLKKENFNLKMKIFFLEERLANGDQNSNVDLINANAELKIQNGSLKQDLN